MRIPSFLRRTDASKTQAPGLSSQGVLLIEPNALDAWASDVAGMLALYGRDALDSYDTPLLAPEVDANGNAHISIRGLIAEGVPGFYEVLNYATDPVRIANQVNALQSTPGVSAITLHVDSPGGYVRGVQVASNAIRDSQLPVTAIVGAQAASAAYWIVAHADSILLRDELSQVGSVGAFATIVDASKAFDEAGLKAMHFASGSHKGAFAFGTEATEEQQAEAQSQIDHVAGIFQRTVYEARSINSAELQTEIATGKSFFHKDAMRLGLADGMAPSASASTSAPASPEANETAPQSTNAAQPQSPSEADANASESQKDTSMDINEFLASLTDEQRLSLDKWKADDSAPAAQTTSDRADIPEDVKVQLAAQASQIAALEEASTTAKYTAEAEAFGALPGMAASDIAASLRAADSAGPEVGKSVRSALASAQRIAADSPLFAKQGEGRKADDPLRGRITARMKADGCTYAQATARVVSEEQAAKRAQSH